MRANVGVMKRSSKIKRDIKEKERKINLMNKISNLQKKQIKTLREVIRIQKKLKLKK